MHTSTMKKRILDDITDKANNHVIRRCIENPLSKQLRRTESFEKEHTNAAIVHVRSRPKITYNKRFLSASLNGFRSAKHGVEMSAISSLDLTSRPLDSHYNTSEDAPCLPFAVACANTCSLTAVADENGCVRIHDYEKLENEMLRFVTHNIAVFDVCWSPDDRQFATASADHEIRVFDLMSRACTAQLAGHTSTVKQILFDKSQPSIMASCGRDGRVALWDLRVSTTSDTLSPVLEILQAHGSKKCAKLKRGQTPATSVTSIALLPGFRIASASDVSSQINTWDVRNIVKKSRAMDSSVVPVQARNYGVTSLVVSHDSSRVYSVSRDSRIYAYATSQMSSAPVYTYSDPSLKVKSFYTKASLSRDGYLACGNSDGSPVIIDTNVESKTKSRRLVHGHSKEVTGVSWGFDGNSLCSISDDTTVRVWTRNDTYRTSQKLEQMDDVSKSGWGWTE